MKPSDKSPEMERDLEALSGRTTSITSNVCVSPPFGCGKPITPFVDEASRKEYTMSGLCQRCQDVIFGA